jgi:hypothetical protein
MANIPPLTAFNLSQRTASHFWAWLEAPGNAVRLARFGRAMLGSSAWESEEGSACENISCIRFIKYELLTASPAFPFTTLPPDSLVVDVGGGIGSQAMRLANQFPDMKFVIQDREATCLMGEDVRM